MKGRIRTVNTRQFQFQGNHALNFVRQKKNNCISLSTKTISIDLFRMKGQSSMRSEESLQKLNLNLCLNCGCFFKP